LGIKHKTTSGLYEAKSPVRAGFRIAKAGVVMGHGIR
jgi:hypothetical protein